ncbi:GntR family transcriptional regulator [Haploplasma axanthum]|uniref:GntR family transcriptional regulator n=1 Tax=Haploplasma axanthum TaxID=29552 RepID=A0A449BBG7_HAPAX|nr:GntR family transcriptional regulator [Haploplasma axanthum]VEU79793.1 GntR family transcriptional regulator [Haploplasma axanthum]
MQLPIYQIIENDIKEQIKNHKIKSGDPIPSENQLKDMYNVSRMTVRQALNNLVNDGYLYKHKGKGTFVSKRKIEKNIHGVRSFTEEMKAMGRVVKNEVIKFDEIEPTNEIREKLFLNENEKVIHIERVRYGDDIPVLHEELYIPHDIFKDLTIEDMSESFYQYVEGTKGYKISHCVQSIEARTPDKNISNALKISKNDPVLNIVRHTFLGNGRPFEYVISTYRSDQYRFVQYAVKD